MRQTIRFIWFLLLPAMLFAACGDASVDGCRIEGYTSFEQYQKAYLTTLDGVRKDSVDLKNGKYRFVCTDSIGEPYAMLVRLQQTDAPYDYIEMPVFIEKGTVKMQIAQYIHTEGTPLNVRLQSFYDQLQALKDSTLQRKDVTVDDINKVFSDFYKQQIKACNGDALGRYLYEAYGLHLTPEDRTEVNGGLNE